MNISNLQTFINHAYPKMDTSIKTII